MSLASLTAPAMGAARAMESASTAWLEGPGDLVWRKEPLASPGLGEITCATIASVISPGTELAAWRGAPPLRPGSAYPRVQGYCNVARIEAVGAKVEGYAPGDRVLTLQSHRSHFACAAQEVYFTLDPGMDAAQIATSYLFHLGYNAILRSGARAGHRVAIIGLGVLGLSSVAMAGLAGAQVYALSSHPSSLAIARDAYGATGVYTRADRARLAHDLGGGGSGGADIIILTTSGWEDFQLALEIAGQNAVIACLGFPGREQAPGAFNPLASEYFYTKQLRIESVGLSPLENDPRGFNRFNLRDNIGFIARAIAEGRVDPAPILSGVYPAHELARAYTALSVRKDNAITYQLDWAA